MKLFRRIRALFRRGSVEAEMQAEMRHHLEEQAARNRSAGMAPHEAALAARRQFGNLASLQEQAREVRGWLWADNLLRDLSIGLRVLVRERGFFAISVAVIALGVGGVTAQFSVINSALIRGLPFPDSEQLVRVTVRDPSWAPRRTQNVYVRDLLAWSREQKSFSHLVGYWSRGSFIVTIDEVPERFPGSHVTGSLFALLGVKPAKGRDFTEEDQRAEAPRVTVISDSLWKAEFGGDPNILGRAIRLNGTAATVVGVMPPGFSFPAEQLWMPMFNEDPPGTSPDWTGGQVTVIGRLATGVTPGQAAAELSLLARHTAAERPKSNRGLSEVLVEPLMAGFISRDTRDSIWVMTGAVTMVLLIACLNVMNMQFARATLRTRELALRGALGASRARLVVQMLVESLLVAVPGAAGGALLSVWAVDLYRGSGLPEWIQFEINPIVLAFTLGATGATVLLSGLLPALIASRVDPLAVLKTGGRGQTNSLVGRFTGLLVVGQVALTAALLVASLLLVKSLTTRYTLDFGYEPDSVLAGRVNFSVDYATGEDAIAGQGKVLERVRASPQFAGAAFSSRRNNLLTSESRQIQLEDADQPLIAAWVESVSDGYFATLGLRPVAGREFAATDTRDRPTPALVNETFARKHLPGRSPVGRRLRIDPASDRWCTIVGVVPDTLMQGPLDATRDGAGVFVPTMSYPQGYLTLVVRGRSKSAAQLVEPLRREVLAVDPNLAVYTVGTPRQAMGSVLGQLRTITQLFSLFAGIAMVLSAVGLYGITAFAVGQRTQEFGVRLALGARPAQVRRLVLRQGATRLGIGGVVGSAAALLVAQLTAAKSPNVLHGVSPHDPAVYLVVGGLLTVTTLVACLVPSRRAARIDPMVALRAE